MDSKAQSRSRLARKLSIGFSLGALFYLVWINLIAANVAKSGAANSTHLSQLAQLGEKSGDVTKFFPLVVLAISLSCLIMAIRSWRWMGVLALVLLIVASAFWYYTFVFPHK